jgi:hypothetical protein
MEKLSQDATNGKVDVRGNHYAPARAEHPVEHPRRDLTPSVRRLSGNAATEDCRVTLLDHFIDMDLPPGPGVPRIKKLALNAGLVDVPLSSCTILSGRTHRSDIDHQRRRHPQA